MSSDNSKGVRSADEAESILAAPSGDVMSLGYGLCPQMVFRDSRLEPGAKAIYGYLASFAGAGMTAFPSQALMLEELNMSRPTYTKHLKQLQAYGYVKVERRKNKRNEFMSNVYELVREPAIDEARMSAYDALRQKTLEASRMARAMRESGIDGATRDALAAILGNPETAKRAIKAIVENSDAVENPPVSNNFTLEENPSSEPVSNNFTVDGPVLNNFMEPLSNNFTVANSVNSNKGKVTETTYQPTQIDSQVETGCDVENSAGRAGVQASRRQQEFERLVADSMKPVPAAKMVAVRDAYERRLAEGYTPSEIARAYEAYRAAYAAEHKTLKQAKQLERWLTAGDGLVTYATMIEAGPAYRQGVATNASAGVPVNDVERRALSRIGNEELSVALERVDPTFRELLANLERARRVCEQTGESKDWEVWQALGEQADAYLASNRKRATAEYLRLLRSRSGND